ncbi:MAG: hypothetical protein GTN37_01195, partial [Candidatus Aenigmarchaeota archaeon]|nr:hypothetical protein [Candidatus Aenigmarchaeota archaeon]NIS73029.1 hypothetical protein [Candidatus Aenigmarchaeota archaeon]
RELAIKIGKKDHCHRCYRHYKENIVDVLRKKLELTKIIQIAKPHISGYHIGSRELYRKIFTP